jgi:hypothetical protein
MRGWWCEQDWFNTSKTKQGRSETHFYVGVGGGESITLLQGPQASPACSSSKRSMKVEIYEKHIVVTVGTWSKGREDLIFR